MSKKIVPSLCPYCAVGCGFNLVVEQDKAIGIEYNPEHPVNNGSLCPKGNAVLEFLNHEERLRYPMKRIGADWVRISWDEALDLVARGLSAAIRDHGPRSLGFLASSRCNNEESYLMQKLARSLRSPNVDNCARLCHAPTVMGLGLALGTGAMTNNLQDLENSSCILAIGTNLAEAHPVVSQRVVRAKDAGSTVIVADPRITPTSWMADIFLRLKPGSDIDLIRGMIKVILDEGLEDKEFIKARTNGFSDFVKSLEGYTVEKASELTGVPAKDIVRAARIYASSPASALLYSMGITQHIFGTDNVLACANLALIAGQIGRPGAGIWPMRGQNNVQGTCDMGAITEFYPGYGKIIDKAATDKFSSKWDIDLPEGPGLTSTEMVEKALEGSLKAMYIIGEDPIICDANVNATRKAFESLDFLVVQDIFMTATAQMADVVLPAAAWAEKDGSYTSMERRIQWIDKAVNPVDEAREGLSIICDIAKRLNLDFDYPSASDVLQEISDLVPQYKGVTKERIATPGGLIWPVPNIDHPGTLILHTERFSTPDGRARITVVTNRPAAEEPVEEYPFHMITGRTVLHYNSGSMTRRSPSLLQREPELFVDINIKDAARIGIKEGDMVKVSTKRGQAEARARVSEAVLEGMIFMPFHFHGTNLLTSGALDPVSKIPEYKAAACRIEPLS